MNVINNKRKRDSQERIEKTFLNLIQTKELKDITISRICKDAHVNRTTFYANYLDIDDLKDAVRNRMVEEFASLFNNERGHSPSNYLIMFQNIKDNQIFYRTYFKFGYDNNYHITYFDQELADRFYDNKYIPYHCEFFKAGITAIIKMWLNNNCQESPEEMCSIIETEYQVKK